MYRHNFLRQFVFIFQDMGYIFSPGESIGMLTQRHEHTSGFAAFNAMDISLSPSTDDARKMKDLNKENNDPLMVNIYSTNHSL